MYLDIRKTSNCFVESLSYKKEKKINFYIFSRKELFMWISFMDLMQVLLASVYKGAIN